MRPRKQLQTSIVSRSNDFPLKTTRPGRSRLRSLLARGLATAVLAAFTVLMALPLQAQTPTPAAATVPDDWSLKPSGLTDGDQFRLLFVSTTTRDGSSTDIADYNTHVQTAAAAGHADIQAYSSGFRALACTATTDARDNTGTTGTGVPIYWVNSSKVSDDYDDLYDGYWDSNLPYGEDGGFAGTSNLTLTGCSSDGTEYPDQYLGADTVRLGYALASRHELSNRPSLNNTEAHTVYGLSEVFEVGVASTDATLSGLVLEVASINRAIRLTPSTFAATTTSYTASVSRGVGEITVKPTVNESNATFVILDGSDSELTDADTSQDDFQVSVSQGANTIKVKVTAEDTSTTATYTVTVTRAPNAVPTFTDGATTSRHFNETSGDTFIPSAPPIRTPVVATDTDTTDTLSYSLEGADAAKFDIVSTSGQLLTRVGEKYDYEAKPSYAVTVKVEDGSGGSATIAVTLNVTDRNEPPLASDAPTVEATTGSATSLDASWTVPSNTGRPEITFYDLQYKKTSDSTWADGPLDVATTSASIPGLVAETSYDVQVRVINDEGIGPWSQSGTGTTTALPAVTVSKTALTVTEEDATGDTYTVVIDSQPTADVTVTVVGHVSTDVTLTPSTATLAFTSLNWETAQTVTVTAADDADTTDDTVTLTHSATSTDADYNAISIDGVTVTVNDNDTAQVMGVMIAPGNAQLVVNWTAVDNATGYTVQWKSGVEVYNTGDRLATVASGSITSHTIDSLANDTEYTVQVIATRTGANDGPPSAEVKATPVVPTAPGITVSESTLTLTEEDSTGDGYTVVLDTLPTADVTVTVAGHASTDVTLAPDPPTLTFTTQNWDTSQAVTVTAVDDADTTNDTVTLTHSATSTDADYNAISIAGVTVTVNDNDTAQVIDVEITPGDAELVVEWTAVDNATGYNVQWKSGVGAFNTGDRQAAVTSGSTTSYTIASLTNYTEYTVQVIATRTGANDGPPSAEVKSTPTDSPNNAPPVFTLATESLNIEETLGAATASAVADVGGAVDATDDDNDTLTYSLDGLHKDRFTIVSTSGQIQTKVGQRYDHEADQFLSLKVMADDGNGGTATADVTVFLTDQAEPPLKPTALTLVQASPTSLDLRWTAPDNTGRPEITGYTAQFRTAGGNWTTRALGTATSATLTGLVANTEYDIQVRAVNDEGNGAWSQSGVHSTAEAALQTQGVTVTPTELTVTEEDATADSYTVVLDTQPSANVTVTVAGHAGTDVTPSTITMTFTPQNWDTDQMVTVTAADDADITNDSVTLTHSAASTDTDYDGITIADVMVTVADNDTAQVSGVMVTPGNARLEVAWEAVDNATGYLVQWKSGVEAYNTGDRQATVSSGSTTSHTIPSLTIGDEYTVRVTATRTGANDGLPSEEAKGTPIAPAVTVSETALTVTEEAATGASYTIVLVTQPTADVTVTVAGHAGTEVTLTPDPSDLTFTPQNWDTAQTVTVTAVDDADTTNDSVTLTHTATSTDTDYDAITIAGVTVTANDNDTAQVVGVTVTPGHQKLRVTWTPVDNATANHVQWKSGVENYNTTDRQATVTAAGYTILGLTNGTEYTVQVTAVRTGANDGPPSAEMKGTPVETPGVTVSIATLSVTEEDATGDSYTVVLDTEPTADVTVTVAGHASTDVTPSSTTLTFTTLDWDTPQTVTVTAGDDADVTDDTVTLTHTAASTDTDYDGVTFDSVTVTVNDNDTAQVMGMIVASGNAQLVVIWAAVDNATGYLVQWKSGGEAYNTGDRQTTVTSGSTTSHTIPDLTNDTEYTVRVTATRTGANDGSPSAEVKGTPEVPPGITVSQDALTVTEENTTGESYTVVLDAQPEADVTVTVAGHADTDVTLAPDPATLTFTPQNWSTAQTITVTAANDADTTNDSVTLTHSATSTDAGYEGITIAVVTVTVKDNDSAPRLSGGGGGGGGFGPAPVAPNFADGFRTSRPLAMNAQAGGAVGDPVAATHPNNADVIYSLSGADAALFEVDEETGQIRVAQEMALSLGQTYTVNLTASDSTGTGAIIIVDIEVVEPSSHRYDLDHNGTIELDEAEAAVEDYLQDDITLKEAVEVIHLYYGI